MEKIVHVMLTGPVTDGWSYQDNLLTKYQRRLGYEVTMITSQWIWGDDGKLAKCEKTDYRNENDVFVIRLPIKGKDEWGRKFKRFSGLYENLVKEKPDILFVHNVSFIDMDVVVKYSKRRMELDKTNLKAGSKVGKVSKSDEAAESKGAQEIKEKAAALRNMEPQTGRSLKVYVDNHSDFSNSGTNWLSRNVLHKILWRNMAARIEPYAEKFYGVMPSRVEWLKEMYRIPEKKCELLVMGADDDRIKDARKTDARSRIRKKYGIKETDFLIMTGGKIDRAKRQTLLLMEAVRNLCSKDSAELALRLIVFGSVTEELKPQMETLVDGKTVQCAGWILPEESYDYFAAADLVVFPGRHSVYWEQVVGMGIPMICKYWDGTTHVDIGGNVSFLHEDSEEALRKELTRLLQEGRTCYKEMAAAARSDRAKGFLYQHIAEKSVAEGKLR